MIEVTGLEKGYGRYRTSRKVLRGIDLKIESGQAVGLVGANGAGKTTLLLCMVGLLFPDYGTVTVGGKSIKTREARRLIGFVPEASTFDRGLSGIDFLLYMGKLGGVPGGDLSRRITELLIRFGLTDVAEKKLGTYSRGLTQRLALCQALLSNPHYLILDEPASNLDPPGVLLVRREIMRLRDEGVTVFLSSHHLTEVDHICSRIVFLAGGRLREVHPKDNIESLFSDPQ